VRKRPAALRARYAGELGVAVATPQLACGELKCGRAEPTVRGCPCFTGRQTFLDVEESF